MRMCHERASDETIQSSVVLLKMQASGAGRFLRVIRCDRTNLTDSGRSSRMPRGIQALTGGEVVECPKSVARVIITTVGSTAKRLFRMEFLSLDSHRRKQSNTPQHDPDTAFVAIALYISRSHLRLAPIVQRHLICCFPDCSTVEEHPETIQPLLAVKSPAAFRRFMWRYFPLRPKTEFRVAAARSIVHYRCFPCTKG
jgi:hypothetical protein